MLHALTTTAKIVVQPSSVDRKINFSAGNFSTAVAVYIRTPGTKKVQLILDSDAKSKDSLIVPAKTSLEAYTDAGTADLAVTKQQCPRN